MSEDIDSIPRDLYPFESHHLPLDGGKMHYLDEGPRDGEPVLMLHGNPSWSFYYRRLVTHLSKAGYRCIVPDHIGMGLSDKPDDSAYQYSLARRVQDIGSLVEHLHLERPLTLVVHDWGGMIGMAWATEHAAEVSRLVVLNTGAFGLPEDKPFPWPLKLTRTPLGTLLVQRFNAFSAVAAKVCVKRAPMAERIRAAYVAPYNSAANRIATLRFVQDIPLSVGDRGYEIVKRTEANLSKLNHLPTLICWGDKDFVFDHAFLRQWRRHFPSAVVHQFPDCGHYVLEDAPGEILPLVETFLSDHPLTAAATEAAHGGPSA